MIGHAIHMLRSEGLLPTVRAVYDFLLPRRLRSFDAIRPHLEGRAGLEIGGPSRIFGPRGNIPVYPLASVIDNCTFTSATIWEGQVAEGQSFRFAKNREPGRQFIVEASDLRSVSSETYEFVLSSHCIEHLANPIKALYEWIRVMRPGGLLVLVVPDKARTFDHKRPVTMLEHLIRDLREGTGEDDSTHVEEILSLHDHEKDWRSGGPEAFRARAVRNLENRCLHHHVFDVNLVVDLVKYTGLEILDVECMRPCHIAVLAKK